IKSQKQELDLLNQQFQLGAVAKGDVLAQQAQAEQTEATLPPLQKQLVQVRNAMAVLLGQIPAQADIGEVTFDAMALPTEIPVSFPSKIVDQRPDVRASEALLHQASAQIGVATAQLFPNFTLSGNYQSSGTNLGAFVTGFPNGGTWSLLGTITQPLFHG